MISQDQTVLEKLHSMVRNRENWEKKLDKFWIPQGKFDILKKNLIQGVEDSEQELQKTEKELDDKNYY